MSSLARSIALSLLFAASGAQAAPWTYRGTLSDNGAPANGRYDIRLSVLDAGGVKSRVYPLTFTGVEVRDGAFAVDVDFGVDLTQLGALKLKTEVAQGGSGFVALGEPQPFDAKAALVGVCWDTQGNAGTNPATDFLGTTDNQALNLRANNQRVGQLAARGTTVNWGDAPSVALGSSANVASGFGATVGGGGATRNGFGTAAANQNQATGIFATVAGGLRNIAADDGSTVSGGLENSALGEHNAIGGGIGNTTSGINTVVSGGASNVANESYAAVGGGTENTASNFASTVAGGQRNIASGSHSAVSGGDGNCAGASLSWAGGYRAKVRPGINPGGTGSCSTLTYPGGTGDSGTFIWADSQVADFLSSGPNQFLVRADGGVGINGTPAAAGLEMNIFGTTPFDGFVELSLIPKPSLNGNTGERVEFGVGKGGAGSNDADLRIVHRNDSGGASGYFEHVNIDGDGSVIVRSNPANPAQGVQLAIGAGGWSTLSDRNLKTDIRSILPLDVLERLVAMPIQQWRYIGQPGEVQHIGPMAQDFAAAFGVGENDTTISTVDADGVALAAIQGLNQKLETELAQSRAENAGLQAQLQQLAARLAALEAAGER